MSTKTVIIIDDSKFVQERLSRFFSEELEFDVVATGADGSAAVELYKRLMPDLITIDVMMPTMDGMAALKEILRINPDANIMMISAVRGDTMLKCMAAGAKGYVEKPVRFNDSEFVKDFVQTIKEVVG